MSSYNPSHSLWALTMKSKVIYDEKIDRPFCITHASLDTSLSDNAEVRVVMRHRMRNYLLCCLKKNMLWQMPLKIKIKKGEFLQFACSGNGFVQLTGYIDYSTCSNCSSLGNKKETTEKKRKAIEYPTDKITKRAKQQSSEELISDTDNSNQNMDSDESDDSSILTKNSDEDSDDSDDSEDLEAYKNLSDSEGSDFDDSSSDSSDATSSYLTDNSFDSIESSSEQHIIKRYPPCDGDKSDEEIEAKRINEIEKEQKQEGKQRDYRKSLRYIPFNITTMKRQFKLLDQLKAILHARKCERLDREDSKRQCTQSGCNEDKKLLNHLKNCRNTENCTTPKCTMSRKLIGHWKRCKDSDRLCLLCTPTKEEKRLCGRVSIADEQ